MGWGPFLQWVHKFSIYRWHISTENDATNLLQLMLRPPKEISKELDRHQRYVNVPELNLKAFKVASSSFSVFHWVDIVRKSASDDADEEHCCQKSRRQFMETTSSRMSLPYRNHLVPRMNGRGTRISQLQYIRNAWTRKTDQNTWFGIWAETYPFLYLFEWAFVVDYLTNGVSSHEKKSTSRIQIQKTINKEEVDFRSLRQFAWTRSSEHSNWDSLGNISILITIRVGFRGWLFDGTLICSGAGERPERHEKHNRDDMDPLIKAWMKVERA